MRLFFISWMWIGVFASSYALEVVSEDDNKKAPKQCIGWMLFDEVTVYRDPSFFLPHLMLLKSDPAFGWKSLMRENPVLTTLSGEVLVELLAPEREFDGFGDIAAVYEVVDPKLKMRPSKSDQPVSIQQIRICGPNNPYSDSLGFVVVEDVTRARKPGARGGTSPGLPPSIRTNP